MEDFEELKKRLNKYDITYGLFRYFRLLNYHRDFEIIIQPEYLVKKLRIILKGVVSVNYRSRIKEDAFKMDDSYISENQPNPLKGTYWGIKEFEISNYYLEAKNKIISSMQKDYNFKLYSLTFVVFTSEIEFVFHNLETEELEYY